MLTVDVLDREQTDSVYSSLSPPLAVASCLLQQTYVTLVPGRRVKSYMTRVPNNQDNLLRVVRANGRAGSQ